jgi:AcrR family transcriptional regulator
VARRDEEQAGGGTRELILATAARLFRERGYAQTTTRELADAVGIRGPSLYYHFETKQDLLFGICRESVSRLTGAFDSLPPGGDAETRLRSLIRLYVSTIIADRDLHATAYIELRSLTGERRATIVEGFDRYLARIEEVIASAQSEGSLSRDLPARELTVSLTNLLMGTLLWLPHRWSGRPPTPEELTALFTSVFFDGAKGAGRSEPGPARL